MKDVMSANECNFLRNSISSSLINKLEALFITHIPFPQPNNARSLSSFDAYFTRARDNIAMINSKASPTRKNKLAAESINFAAQSLLCPAYNFPREYAALQQALVIRMSCCLKQRRRIQMIFIKNEIFAFSQDSHNWIEECSCAFLQFERGNVKKGSN